MALAATPEPAPDGAATHDGFVALLYILLSEELPYNRVMRAVDRVSATLDLEDEGFRMSSAPLAAAATEAVALLRAQS